MNDIKPHSVPGKSQGQRIFTPMVSKVHSSLYLYALRIKCVSGNWIAKEKRGCVGAPLTKTLKVGRIPLASLPFLNFFPGEQKLSS